MEVDALINWEITIVNVNLDITEKVVNIKFFNVKQASQASQLM